MEANRKEGEKGGGVGGKRMMISRPIAVKDTYVRGSQTQRKDPARSSMRCQLPESAPGWWIQEASGGVWGICILIGISGDSDAVSPSNPSEKPSLSDSATIPLPQQSSL